MTPPASRAGSTSNLRRSARFPRPRRAQPESWASRWTRSTAPCLGSFAMIRFDSVTKTYPGQSRPALNDVGVEILRGEFVFLVGASGSGQVELPAADPQGGEALARARSTCSGRTWGRSPAARCRTSVATSASCSRTSACCRTRSVFENVAFTLRVIGKSRGFIQSAVPETPEAGRPRRQGQADAARTLGWRAAARRHRPRDREQAADPPRRRADRKPRPGHQRRHHDAARAHQRQRHDGGHGHPRGRHRRPDAAPRHRALGRRHRARRARRGLRRHPRRRGRGAHRRCRGARQHRRGDRRARYPPRCPADEDADATSSSPPSPRRPRSPPRRRRPRRPRSPSRPPRPRSAGR